MYICKVFINTEIPFEKEDKTLKKEDTIEEYYKDHPILCKPNVIYGGTGFYFDKAPRLPEEIEHIMPDYNLYKDYVEEAVKSKQMSVNNAKYYIDYSIGFTTRGCIRGCSFCVNQNYKKCSLHSPVSEFLDQDRPYIFLLDDNVLACKDWKRIFEELNATGKRFRFHQGMDERLLTDEKCEVIFKSNWIGDFIFAFDNINDSEIIESKLKLIRKHTDKVLKFYVFCGYNHTSDDYSTEFWIQDIVDVFKRIQILSKYGCIPYIMRHNNYHNSPFRGMYVNLARWCNQVQMFKKKSYREFVWFHEGITKKEHSTIRHTKEFLSVYPEIEKYFDFKFQKQ